jgi:glycosyltransferase involved in cell wall biosynthesis
MVSVILVTWNRAALLPESIESVLRQTYANLELIVADDGSDDDTEQVVRSFNDSRVHYFKEPHTGRTGRLKNLAIQRARGEYIAFNDSDDSWVPHKLEQQLQLMEVHPETGFCITDALTFSDSGVLSEHTYPLQHTIEIASIFHRMKENRFVVFNPSLLVRRRCFDTVGWFDETMLSADFHFNMRLAWHFTAGIIYEPLFRRRVHGANSSRELPIENYEEHIRTFEFLYQQKMIPRKYLQKARTHALTEMGRLYALRRQRGRARAHYLAALQVNPFRPKGYLRLLTTFYP